MRPRDHIVAETVGEGLVDCPIAPGMRKPTQRVRPENTSETRTGPAAAQKVL